MAFCSRYGEVAPGFYGTPIRYPVPVLVVAKRVFNVYDRRSSFACEMAPRERQAPLSTRKFAGDTTMSFSYNADEMYEMAEQIERNGVKFYTAVAGSAADESTKRLLLDLADMEVEHEKVFTALRDSLNAEQRKPMVFDPDDQLGDYLKAMADGKVFDAKADPTSSLTGNETIEEILRIATDREKDTIIFFEGMKEMVSKYQGRDKIDRT